MRRKVLVIALVVSVLFSGGAAFAFQNEPEGFRGLKWGDPPGEKMEFLSKEYEWLRIYRDPGDKLELGDAEFYEISYRFYTPSNATVRRLMDVSLYFKYKGNFDILKTICKVKFGEPTRERSYTLIWMSLATSVSLVYDSPYKYGFLILGSSPIFKQYTEEKEKRQAEEAEKDW